MKSSYRSHPSTASPTAMRVNAPAMLREVTRLRGLGDDVRDVAALDPIGDVGGVSSVVDGIITAPSLVSARMHSQSAARLPSMSRVRSPRRTPWSRSHAASALERAVSSANDSRVSVSSSSTIQSAGRSLPAAMASNQSSAQLKVSGCGHSKVAVRGLVVRPVREQEVAGGSEFHAQTLLISWIGPSRRRLLRIPSSVSRERCP